MSDKWTIRITLFLAGVVPFTLLGGWGDYGDHSIWPWVAGFGCQAAYVWSCCRSLKRRGKTFVF